jgi:hypothetical protein
VNPTWSPGRPPGLGTAQLADDSDPDAILLLDRMIERPARQDTRAAQVVITTGSSLFTHQVDRFALEGGTPSSNSGFKRRSRRNVAHSEP